MLRKPVKFSSPKVDDFAFGMLPAPTRCNIWIVVICLLFSNQIVPDIDPLYKICLLAYKWRFNQIGIELKLFFYNEW